MVTTVLKLRYRSTLNGIKEQWWRGALAGAGLLWAIAMIPSVLLARFVIYRNPTDVMHDGVMSVALLLLLGWLIVPVLVTGLDDTLNPARFSAMGVGARQIMPGLLLSALISIPSLFSLYVLVTLATTWSTREGAAVIVGVVGAVFTWLGLVCGARLTILWTERMMGSSRARTGAFVGFLCLLVALLPLVLLMSKDGQDVFWEIHLPGIVDAVSGAPFLSGLGAAESWFEGETATAVFRLVIAAAWTALLLVAWNEAVKYSLVNPRRRGGGALHPRDRVLEAARSAEARGRSPQTRILRAARMRHLRSWRRDPRYLSSIIGVFALPLLFFTLVLPVGNIDARWSFVVPLALATTIAMGRHNDLAMDNSAIWLDVVSGQQGTLMMKARAQAVLVWAGPLVAAAALIVGLIPSSPYSQICDPQACGSSVDVLFALALVASSLATLVAGLAVATVLSVPLAYRTTPPGANPLGAEFGGIGAALLAQVLSAVAIMLVTVPVALVMYGAFLWHGVWSIAAIALGAVWIVLFNRYGSLIAGKMYNARTGTLIGVVS